MKLLFDTVVVVVAGPDVTDLVADSSSGMETNCRIFMRYSKHKIKSKLETFRFTEDEKRKLKNCPF